MKTRTTSKEKTKAKTKKPINERKKYSVENLKKALDAVMGGMSKKLAAKLFQVPISTIQFRINNPDKTDPRPGPSTVLTYLEENALVNWIVESSKKGFPRRKEDIQHTVSDFIKKANRPNPFKNHIPGAKWLKLFLNRHPEISIRTPESVTAASSVVSENDIRAWFNGIETYLKDNDFFDILSDSNRVLNGDETNFLLCPKTGVVLALKGDKNVYEIDRGQAKVAITVMFTFCANGGLTPPMVILPYKRLPGEIAAKIPNEWGIGLSENGWMKADLFYEYIKNVLHPYLIKQGKTFPVILFVDGHKTHLTLQVSELCSELKIILIALYPNCTRILQPADVAAFFPLKCAWKKSVLRWRRDHPGQALTKLEFVSILQTAVTDSLKSDTIKNGFRACGLQPWNADALDYTKCLGEKKTGNSKEKQTGDSQAIKRIDSKGTQTEDYTKKEIHHKNQMTQEAFINIIGRENLNKLTRKDLNMIPDASQLLQNIWEFFERSSTTTGNSKTPDVSEVSLKDQLDIENMPVIWTDHSPKSNNETSIATVSNVTSSTIIETENSDTPIIPKDSSNYALDIQDLSVIWADNVKKTNNENPIATVSHEVEIHSSYEPELQCVPGISGQQTVNQTNMQKTSGAQSDHDPVKNIIIPKTPCKLKLTPVNINDILVLPKTPKRKGTKNSEKKPFVLTSEEWQRINTQKKMAKELKEEGIKKRKFEREQKKIVHEDKKQYTVKGKGKGKGKGKVKIESVENVKKLLFSREFYLPSPIDNQVYEKENTVRLDNQVHEKENTPLKLVDVESFYEKDQDKDDAIPSRTSKKGFTCDEIFKMLAD